MPVVTENDVTLYRGETLPMKITVYDKEGNLATGITSGTIKLRKTPSVSAPTVEIVKECYISGAEVRVEFDSEETSAMSGLYHYEVRVTTGTTKKDTVLKGAITVQESLF